MYWKIKTYTFCNGTLFWVFFFFCLSSLRACHSLIFQLCGNPLTGLDLEDKADNIRVNTKAWGLKNWDSVPKGSSWGALRWGWHGTSSIGTLESFEDSTAENSGGLKRKMDLLGSTGAPEWWPRSVFCGDLSIGQAGFLNSSDEKPNPDLFPLTTVVNCIICCEDNLTLFTLHSFYGLFSVFFFVLTSAVGLDLTEIFVPAGWLKQARCSRPSGASSSHLLNYCWGGSYPT